MFVFAQVLLKRNIEFSVSDIYGPTFLEHFMKELIKS